jgi:hypothetical protein
MLTVWFKRISRKNKCLKTKNNLSFRRNNFLKRDFKTRRSICLINLMFKEIKWSKICHNFFFVFFFLLLIFCFTCFRVLYFSIVPFPLIWVVLLFDWQLADLSIKRVDWGIKVERTTQIIGMLRCQVKKWFQFFWLFLSINLQNFKSTNWNDFLCYLSVQISSYW